MVQNSNKPPRIAALFRKTLILPAEHGSWAWLLVPFGVGTAVASNLILIGQFINIGHLIRPKLFARPAHAAPNG